MVWFGFMVWIYDTSTIFIHINGSISNNSVLHKYTVLMSKTETSPSECSVSYPGHSLFFLPPGRDAVGVFYSLSWQGKIDKGYNKIDRYIHT